MAGDPHRVIEAPGCYAQVRLTCTDPDDPFIQLVAKLSEEVYEMPMQLVPLVGGSGPSHPFVHDLNLPVATAGLGYPDTKAHAPNENIRVDLYLKHARHMARIIKEFAK